MRVSTPAGLSTSWALPRRRCSWRLDVSAGCGLVLGGSRAQGVRGVGGDPVSFLPGQQVVPRLGGLHSKHLGSQDPRVRIWAGEAGSFRAQSCPKPAHDDKG